MAASSLADHNYLGAYQSVNTDTPQIFTPLDIPSSKIDNIKKSLKILSKVKSLKLSEPPQPTNFKKLKCDLQIDKQLSNNKTMLNLQGLHPEPPETQHDKTE